MKKKIVIVGAGPAGIGLGILLKKLKINDFVILERDQVGSSFFNWPKEMKLLTPSFTGHGFGSLDLNAITPETSPAYTFKKEHLTGQEYGEYLSLLAEHFDLPVYENVNVEHVERKKSFILYTSDGMIEADQLIWAAGEFNFPNARPFEGAGYAIHSSQVQSWEAFEKNEYTIIGGYESGIDAASHLISSGNSATIFSRTEAWKPNEADPSLSLSPYTYERLKTAMATKKLRLIGGSEVTGITKEQSGYQLLLADGATYFSKTKPILATGFLSGAKQIESFFEWREDGLPHLTENDESTIVSNLFLIGPSVRQQAVIFCFIYKFRQRFAVVAKEVITRLGLDCDEKVFDNYRRNQMFLDDLSCCGVECEC
ncbi:NAD(P)/FAD-dependent oxidoreductase [Bacillus gobiensis]|uniref:NAD(P)/FAD-dependent oxidoreductase n=1 Tax=Bacillus gobiensis TaxID=1441095 RepID=UPI003D25D84B